MSGTKHLTEKLHTLKKSRIGIHRISRPMLIEALWTLKQSTGLLFFIHWTTMHFFIMLCTSLKSFKNIRSYNTQLFNSLDCIDLHCIANCWFSEHCNVLDCTPPPTLHSTTLHCRSRKKPIIVNSEILGIQILRKNA